MVTLELPQARATIATAPTHAADPPIVLHTSKGRALLVRHLQQEDGALLTDFFSRLSARTHYLRFGRPQPADRGAGAAHEAARALACAREGRGTLVALSVDEPRAHAIALAEIVPERRQPGVAEAALIVRDDYQGEGLGGALATLMVDIARRLGILVIQADVLAENTAVLRLMRRVGLPHTIEARRGELRVLAQVPHAAQSPTGANGRARGV